MHAFRFEFGTSARHSSRHRAQYDTGTFGAIRGAITRRYSRCYRIAILKEIPFISMSSGISARDVRKSGTVARPGISARTDDRSLTVKSTTSLIGLFECIPRMRSNDRDRTMSLVSENLGSCVNLHVFVLICSLRCFRF